MRAASRQSKLKTTRSRIGRKTRRLDTRAKTTHLRFQAIFTSFNDFISSGERASAFGAVRPSRERPHRDCRTVDRSTKTKGEKERVPRRFRFCAIPRGHRRLPRGTPHGCVIYAYVVVAQRRILVTAGLQGGQRNGYHD